MPGEVRQALEKEEVGQVSRNLGGTAVQDGAQSASRRQLLLSPGPSLLCRSAGGGWIVFQEKSETWNISPPEISEFLSIGS